MKMRTLIFLLVTIMLLSVSSAKAEVLFSDDFQSYSGTDWKSTEGGPWLAGGYGSYTSLQTDGSNQYIHVLNGSASGQAAYITTNQGMNVTQISSSESVKISVDVLGGTYQDTEDEFRMSLLADGNNYYGSTNCIELMVKKTWVGLYIKKDASAGWTASQGLVGGNANLSAGGLTGIELELTATDYTLRVPVDLDVYGITGWTVDGEWKYMTGEHNLNWTEFTSSKLCFETRRVVGEAYMDLDNVMVETVSVPEPVTVALLALGGLAGVIRKRK